MQDESLQWSRMGEYFSLRAPLTSSQQITINTRLMVNQLQSFLYYPSALLSFFLIFPPFFLVSLSSIALRRREDGGGQGPGRQFSQGYN